MEIQLDFHKNRNNSTVTELCKTPKSTLCSPSALLYEKCLHVFSGCASLTFIIHLDSCPPRICTKIHLFSVRMDKFGERKKERPLLRTLRMPDVLSHLLHLVFRTTLQTWWRPLYTSQWRLRVSVTRLRSYNDRLRTHTHSSLTLQRKLFPLREDTRRLLSEAEVWWRRTRITTTGFTHRWRSTHCWWWFRDSPAFAKGY